MKFLMNKNLFKEKLEAKLTAADSDFSICGLVNKDGDIFPLGTDTKVLSTLFELFVRPILVEFAKENNLDFSEASVQNCYPDFTLTDSSKSQPNRIAIDVKTTYVKQTGKKFKYTLGGYTSFIRNPTKNIAHPFDEYESHWVIGFVYTRVATRKSADAKVYSLADVEKIPLAYKDVEWFVEEKWKLSGDSAGSGNTTNIGSVNENIEWFKKPEPIFKDEEEFLDFWRHYGKTKKEREKSFKNLDEFRSWKKTKSS